MGSLAPGFVHGMCATASAILFATVPSAVFAETGNPAVAHGSPCDAPSGAELSLARRPSLYAVVDGPSGRIELRARGVVLRRFPLRDVSSIGRGPAPTGPWVLVAKLPLIDPIPRVPPLPGDPASPESRVDDKPLTVAAMPARYRLVFQGGLWIVVHPGGAGARWQRLLDRLGAMTDRIGAWAGVLAGRFVGARRRVLLVELTAEEARALYWAVRPPLPVLLRVACPSGEPIPGPNR
jgi:hypothetical protein